MCIPSSDASFALLAELSNSWDRLEMFSVPRVVFHSSEVEFFQKCLNPIYIERESN